MPELLLYNNYVSVAYSTSLSAFALGKLQRLQNRAIRAVFTLPPTSSVSHQRESISLRKIEETQHHRLLDLNWRGLNGQCSTVLSKQLTPATTATTRQHANAGLILPLARTNTGTLRPLFRGPALWNTLPASLRSSKGVTDFAAVVYPYTLRP